MIDLARENARIVVLDDVDRDGDLDAFVGHEVFGRVWTNDGSGHFSKSGQRFNWSPEYAGNLADVDGDGDEDVFAIRFNGDCLVWRNDGTGHFGQEGDGAITLIYLAVGGAIVLGLGLFGWRAIRAKGRS